MNPMFRELVRAEQADRLRDLPQRMAARELVRSRRSRRKVAQAAWRDR
jgi:hypothetical protein